MRGDKLFRSGSAVGLIQRRRDLVRLDGLINGLLKNFRFAEFFEDVEAAIAGNENDRQSRSRDVNGSCEFDATYFRHSNICQNDVDFELACDQPKRFPAALGRNCCISEKLEQPKMGRSKRSGTTTIVLRFFAKIFKDL
jgi:hypothetical protein